MVEEARSETNVSAQQSTTGQAARLPPSDVDPRRSSGVAQPPAEGTASPVGLIWRVRDRRSFAALRQRGQRVRRGPVTVAFLPGAPHEAGEPPKVAFAVGRRIGRAVHRNRVRRQLRSIMRELVAQANSPVQPGTYLVGVNPQVTTLSYQELKSTVEAALRLLATNHESNEEPPC